MWLAELLGTHASASVVFFLWGGVSGGQAPVILIKRVPWKACSIAAGIRDGLLNTTIDTAVWSVMDMANFFLLCVTPLR